MASDTQMELSLSARGFTDQDIEKNVIKKMLEKAYTTVNLSLNFITQLGAVVLANELQRNSVSAMIASCF